MTTNRLEHIDLARTMAVVSVIAYHFLRMQAYLRAYARPYADQMAFAGQFGDIFRTIHYPVCYKKNVYGTSVIALHYLHPLYSFAAGSLINCDTAA